MDNEAPPTPVPPGFCSRCGTPLERGAGFCRVCGAARPLSAPTVGSEPLKTDPSASRQAASVSQPTGRKRGRRGLWLWLSLAAVVVVAGGGAIAGITLGGANTGFSASVTSVADKGRHLTFNVHLFNGTAALYTPKCSLLLSNNSLSTSIRNEMKLPANGSMPFGSVVFTSVGPGDSSVQHASVTVGTKAAALLRTARWGISCSNTHGQESSASHSRVDVPAIQSGASLSQAEAEIRAAGLRAKDGGYTKECLGAAAAGTVYETEPRPTTTVLRGSTVVIYLCPATDRATTTTTSPTGAQPPAALGATRAAPWELSTWAALRTALDAALPEPLPSSYKVWIASDLLANDWYFVATTAPPGTSSGELGPVDLGEGVAKLVRATWELAEFGTSAECRTTVPGGPVMTSGVLRSLSCPT